MLEIPTNTKLYRTGSSRRLDNSGYKIRVFDVLVVSSGTNQVWMKLSNGSTESDAGDYLYLTTEPTGANYAVYTSTNLYSFSANVDFQDGCYITTSSGFGYATITYGLLTA